MSMLRRLAIATHSNQLNKTLLFNHYHELVYFTNDDEDDDDDDGENGLTNIKFTDG